MARIILVALFVLAVSAQRAPLHSCTPRNAFAQHMSTLGMPLYDFPKMGVSMCGNEFRLHGTCCNEKAIKDYVAKDKKAISEATEKIIYEFDNFIKSTPQLLKLAEDVVKLRSQVQMKYLSQKGLGLFGRNLQMLRNKSIRKIEPKPAAQIRAKISNGISHNRIRLQGAHLSHQNRPAISFPTRKPLNLSRQKFGKLQLSSSKHTQAMKPKLRFRVSGSLGVKNRENLSSYSRKHEGNNKLLESTSRRACKRSKLGRKRRFSSNRDANTHKRIASASAKTEDSMEIIRQLRFLITKLRDIHAGEQFGTNTETCWNHIAAIRASSVCSTCSGRSKQFFWRRKALMSQEVCVGVLDRCYKPLRQLNFFVNALNLIPKVMGLNSKVSDLNHRVKVDDDTSTLDLSSNLKSHEVSTLAALFEKADFIKLTKKYEMQNRLRGTEYFNPELLFNAERDLCSRFVVLNDVPIIVQVMRLFAQTNDAQTHAKDLLHQMNSSIDNAEKILNRKGIINPNWRVLQLSVASTANTQSLGADVTIISMENHSAYSGVGVSGNHAMDFSNQP